MTPSSVTSSVTYTGGPKQISFSDGQVTIESTAVTIKPTINNQPTLIPDNWPAGMVYTVGIGDQALQDSAKNYFQGINATSYRFTVADGQAPSVLDKPEAYYPRNGAVGVSASTNITIQFNEAVQAGTGDVKFTPDDAKFKTECENEKSRCEISVTAAQVVFSGNSMQISPQRPLLNKQGSDGLTYTVEMGEGVVKAHNPNQNSFPNLNDNLYHNPNRNQGLQ